MRAIHQFVAGFARGDAISNEALELRALFRSWGFRSDIFSEAKRILPDLRREAFDAESARDSLGPGDAVLLHLSIGSPVNLLFESLPCRKVIRYHNITPPAYFELWRPETARSLARGLEQVRALAGKADVNTAVSRFNAVELEALGYRDVRVVPLLLDLARLKQAPDRRVLRSLDDGKANVLFVGRCAPNKKIEDLLAAFACFQRAVEPHSRLIHVGSWAGCERYHGLLLSMARQWGLRDVIFAGSVPQAELNAYFEAARLFLCMSEHEGFCIPVLEAMLHDVPVMALAAAAVPETMDGAGVLFRDRDLPLVAEMMGRLARTGPLRAAVIEGQRARIGRYAGRRIGDELRAALAPVLSAPEERGAA